MTTNHAIQLSYFFVAYRYRRLIWHRYTSKLQPMKTRFIVLIDFSSYSKSELQLAKHWADSMAADLLLLHEPIIMAPALTDGSTRDEISKYETDKALNKLKGFAIQHLPDTRRISYHVADESLIFSLQRLLGEYYYHVVFVGLKGTGFLKRIFIGSMAIRVIDETNNAVVAVPRHSFNMSPDTLYVGIHYKYKLNTAEFDKVLHLFGGKIKHIRFMSVVTQKDSMKQTIAYLEELREQYRGERDVYVEIFKGEDAFYTLKQYMNVHADGMLVVQKGSRSFTSQVFRRFLINELVYDASVPLIVLPLKSGEV
jgi:nucleotide-binding universal stress UspA family protein